MECPRCHGGTTIKCPRCNGDGGWDDGLGNYKECPNCGATGEVTCPNCDGTGYVP